MLLRDRREDADGVARRIGNVKGLAGGEDHGVQSPPERTSISAITSIRMRPDVAWPKTRERNRPSPGSGSNSPPNAWIRRRASRGEHSTSTSGTWSASIP